VKNLALIGAGYWGKNLARNFHQLGSLALVCDTSEASLAQQTVACPGIRTTHSVGDVFSDPTIRRVVIAAPAVYHYELAKKALEAGKDVFVEKPLALDAREGAALSDLAEAEGLILMVGHLLQYHPCVRKIQQLLASGELGKLQYITSNRLNLGKIRREENALWSFAPHDISVILSLVGGELPNQVRCIGEAYLNHGVADVTLTTLRFSGGVNAHVHVSWINPFKEQKLTVVGSDGMLVFDDTLPLKKKLLFYSQPIVWSRGQVPVANKSLGKAVDVAEDEPLRIECRHFLECCDQRKAPITDAREGLRVLQVLNAAQRSLDKSGEATNPSLSPRHSSPRPFFAHPTSIIDPAAKIGEGTKIWHFSHVMAGSEIGKNCNLGQNVVVSPSVKLGSNVKVQNNISIYAGTVIEDDVFLGPACVLTNITNPRSEIKRHSLYEKTTIRRGASIGANATIVCGTTLGRFSFVAAGAVVSKDVPDYGFVVGVPAKQKGWMSRHGHLLHFDEQGQATCPESGLRYKLHGGNVNCIDLAEDEPLPDKLRIAAKSYRQLKSSNQKE
jgi:UDP-2-acetamido-3-amino-2,3-dideoxy-glucuronate N-acetyltransferase